MKQKLKVTLYPKTELRNILFLLFKMLTDPAKVTYTRNKVTCAILKKNYSTA